MKRNNVANKIINLAAQMNVAYENDKSEESDNAIYKIDKCERII